MSELVQTSAIPQRLAGWHRRLDALLAAAKDRPFVWGEHDCCLFACAAIEAVTGIDVAGPYRGRYHSRGTAARLLEEAGGVEGIAESVTREHGFREIPPSYAQRGDVVSVNTPRGVALYVVLPCGRRVAGPSPEGLRTMPLGEARRAWRIGQ